MKKQVFGSLILALALSSSAFGFGLSDHEKIMAASIKEFNTCFPGTINNVTAGSMVIADVGEDLNIALKDTLFSHYYNPEKPLKDLIRFDSSVRVKMLASKIKLANEILGKHSDQAASDLAHLMHHIQDMAAPPHVIPVAHGLSDGFEEHTQVNSRISSGYSCQDLQNFSADLTYEQIHHETAVITLAQVRRTPVPETHSPEVDFNNELAHPEYWINSPIENLAVATNELVKIPAKPLSSLVFWQDSSRDHFGKYGFFGNHYGESIIPAGGTLYSVDPQYYQDFKRQQLVLAMQGTLKALSLFYLR